MYIFFDTETNGLPINFKGKMTDLNNWPRIIQLAFVTYDKDFKIKEEFCELIKPDGWTIPVEKFWIEKGYTTAYNNSFGVDIKEALSLFIGEIDYSSYLIAHNINFDYNVIGSEMIRYNLKAKQKLKQFCTMTNPSILNYCKLPGRYNNYKWPKLEELHQILFNESFEGAHDALVDVKATARCFFELLNKQIIKL